MQNFLTMILLQTALDIPVVLHQFMVRGINSLATIKDDQDEGRFLDPLNENISEGHCSIYA